MEKMIGEKWGEWAGWGAGEAGGGAGLHLLRFRLLVVHAVGHVALVQALHAVRLEVDAAGDVFDVLHVRPGRAGGGARGVRDTTVPAALPSPNPLLRSPSGRAI